jgi:rhodanese-related sulfurtransferase
MATSSTVQQINLEDLKKSLDQNEKIHLVNTLSEEWVGKTNGARIPGSHWIPVNEIEQRFPLLFGKSDTIITYCGGVGCSASFEAAEKATALGFKNVRAYEGGLKEWGAAGYTLLTNEAGQPKAESCGPTSCS